MIDTKIEEFTSAGAVEAGLIEAIKRGEAKVSGTYELLPEGGIKFEQNNFLFKDKWGELRVGSFESANVLLEFWEKFEEAFEDETSN